MFNLFSRSADEWQAARLSIHYNRFSLVCNIIILKFILIAAAVDRKLQILCATSKRRHIFNWLSLSKTMVNDLQVTKYLV